MPHLDVLNDKSPGRGLAISDKWKKQNLKDIKKRLNGWQLESFKESYNHKVNKGITLFKKVNQK